MGFGGEVEDASLVLAKYALDCFVQVDLLQGSQFCGFALQTDDLLDLLAELSIVFDQLYF